MKDIHIPGIAVILVLVLVLSCTTASAAVSLYNFTDSINNKAYEGEDSAFPPTVAFLEINQYSDLTSNDDVYQTFQAGAGDYAYTRFEFKINEPISNIEKINMTWMGRGVSGGNNDGYKLYLNQSGSWVERASFTDEAEQTVYIVNTTGFDKIINASGYLIILARSNAVAPNNKIVTIETDFIEVNVTYYDPRPDLNISAPISVKHNYYTGAWANLTNTVKVTVKNNGLEDAGNFNVALYADDAEVGTKSVSSLAAGASTDVVFDWTPNEVKTYTLKAAADPENVIDESNEANNNRTKSQAVGYNGYIGDKPLTTYANGIIKGNLFYTYGDSFYSGELSPEDTYTVDHTVTIPGSATVKFARLYSYWTWSYYALPAYEGKYPVMNLTFDGNALLPEAKYDDRKGNFGIYNFPAGTWAYNVTSFVIGSGNHTTVVNNTDPEIDRDPTFCMDGLGLLVVYEDASGNEVEYWINEGADMVSTMGTSGGLTPQEATVTSLFPGSINLSRVESARLWTVVQSGGHLGTKLIFNAMNWTGVYDSTPYKDLDIDEARDVKDYLVSTDNTAKIESPDFYDDNIGDYLTPSNAFLVINYTSGVPGPNVVVNQNNVSFGGIIKGGTREIIVSLTLINTGTAAANIEAMFITYSGAIYGLTNDTNVIGGSNFSIGINGDEKPLSDAKVQTSISTLAANATVDYDAILLVPADQVEGDYAGTVQLTWS